MEMSLLLQNMCNAQRHWMPLLIEAMHTTVKDGINASIPGCTNGSFVDWVLSAPTYIVLIALHAVFCQEMENCFSGFEANARVFSTYEETLKRRSDDVTESFLMPRSPKDTKKLSIILTVLLGFRDRLKITSQNTPHYSPYLDWLTSLRLRYLPNSASISVEYSDATIEHGYEFWGMIPALLHTPSVDETISSIVYCSTQHLIPLLTGNAATGKQMIVRSCACLFGTFAYVARAFPDMSEYFISRILTGAIASGTWLLFSNIPALSHRALSYLFDTVRSLFGTIGASLPRMTVSSKPVDVNKNCRITFTADANFGNCSHIPPQLKSFTRPIALVIPTIGKTAEALLASEGFQDYQLIASKVSSFLTNAIILVAHDGVKLSATHLLFKILTKVKHIVQTLKMKVAEDLVFAAVSFEQFASSCDVKRKELLLQCLFSTFQIGKSCAEFAEKLKTVALNTAIAELRPAIEKEIASLKIDVPNEYLSERVLALLELMEQNRLIVIVGAPESGKTTVLDVVQRVRENATNFKPLEILPLFPFANSPGRMFGRASNDATVDGMYGYGVFHSAIAKPCFLHKFTSGSEI
jgi:hypothetical protein